MRSGRTYGTQVLDVGLGGCGADGRLTPVLGQAMAANSEIAISFDQANNLADLENWLAAV